MTVYSAQIATAQRLIKAKGAAVTVTQTATTYDPITGGSVPTDTTYSTTAVLLPPDTQTLQAYAAQFEDGTLVLSKVQMALLPAFDATPAPGDTLTAGGVEWSVVGVEPLAPDGAAILHKTLVSR